MVWVESRLILDKISGCSHPCLLQAGLSLRRGDGGEVMQDPQSEAPSLRGEAAMRRLSSTSLSRLRRSKLVSLPQSSLERSRLTKNLSKHDFLPPTDCFGETSLRGGTTKQPPRNDCAQQVSSAYEPLRRQPRQPQTTNRSTPPTPNLQSEAPSLRGEAAMSKHSSTSLSRLRRSKLMQATTILLRTIPPSPKPF